MSLVENMMLLVAPATCLVCGGEGEALCVACASVNMTLFGNRCYVCGRLSEAAKTCKKCARLGGPNHVWINAVYDGVAEQLIDLFKYDANRQAGRFLVHQMAANLPAGDFVLAPVPSASSRTRQRGFDHTLLLAKEISKLTKSPIIHVLARYGQARQVGSTRSERIRQALASYQIKNQNLAKSKKVVLVDDVTTTGATLQACAKLLRNASARRVDALVFAKRI